MSHPRSPRAGTAREHPSDEELADFVDGALPHERRGAVAAHVASCATCTEQVALARSSVAAAAGVEEAPAPGLDPAAIVHRSRTVVPIESRRRVTWVGVAGGLAAAAIAGVFVVGVLHGSGGQSATSAQAPSTQSTSPGGGSFLAPSQGGVAPELTPGTIVSSRDFTRADVAALARSLANGSELSIVGPLNGGKQPPPAADVATATTCGQHVAGTTENPVVVIRATFQGRPAFLTGFKQPHTSNARVVVTPAGSCSILDQAMYQGSASSPGG